MRLVSQISASLLSLFMAVGCASTPAAEKPRAAIAAPVEHARVLPLEHMERQAILDALEFTRGDRARAASLLGIGRTTLYRKLKRYEIEI